MSTTSRERPTDRSSARSMPKGSKRGLSPADEVSPTRNSLAKANPIKSDPELQSLLQDLDNIQAPQSQDQFKGWRASFLERLETFLEKDGVKNAEEMDKAVLTKMVIFDKALNKVQACVDDGQLKEGQKIGVRAMMAVHQLNEHCVETEKTLQKMLPGSNADAKLVGFDKFQMGAVLVRDSFQLYGHIMKQSRHLQALKVSVLEKVVDRQIVDAITYYQRQIQSLCDILADLGLMDVMLKSRVFEGDADSEEVLLALPFGSDSLHSKSLSRISRHSHGSLSQMDLTDETVKLSDYDDTSVSDLSSFCLELDDSGSEDMDDDNSENTRKSINKLMSHPDLMWSKGAASDDNSATQQGKAKLAALKAETDKLARETKKRAALAKKKREKEARLEEKRSRKKLEAAKKKEAARKEKELARRKKAEELRLRAEADTLAFKEKRRKEIQQEMQSEKLQNPYRRPSVMLQPSILTGQGRPSIQVGKLSPTEESSQPSNSLGCLQSPMKPSPVTPPDQTSSPLPSHSSSSKENNPTTTPTRTKPASSPPPQSCNKEVTTTAMPAKVNPSLPDPSPTSPKKTNQSKANPHPEPITSQSAKETQAPSPTEKDEDMSNAPQPPTDDEPLPNKDEDSSSTDEPAPPKKSDSSTSSDEPEPFKKDDDPSNEPLSRKDEDSSSTKLSTTDEPAPPKKSDSSTSSDEPEPMKDDDDPSNEPSPSDDSVPKKDYLSFEASLKKDDAPPTPPKQPTTNESQEEQADDEEEEEEEEGKPTVAKETKQLEDKKPSLPAITNPSHQPQDPPEEQDNDNDNDKNDDDAYLIFFDPQTKSMGKLSRQLCIDLGLITIHVVKTEPDDNGNKPSTTAIQEAETDSGRKLSLVQQVNRGLHG